MFTICLFLFATSTATEAKSTRCTHGGADSVAAAAAECKAVGKSCEMQRTGALSYVVRVRPIGGQ